MKTLFWNFRENRPKAFPKHSRVYPSKMEMRHKTQMKHELRIISIDVVKGIGIFTFIYWHVFENFYRSMRFDSEIYRMLFFVTGLFCLLSGFLIGSHYFSKIVKSDYSWRHAYLRISMRTIKLFLYVLIAGSLYTMLLKNTFTIQIVYSTLSKMFSLFYMNGADVSFRVLFVIAFIIIGGMVLLQLYVKNNNILYIAFYMIVILSCGEFFDFYGINYFWQYFMIGIIGVLYGILSKQVIGENVNQQVVKKNGIIALFVFVSILIAICCEKGLYHIFLEKTLINLVSVSLCFWGLYLLLFLKYDVGSGVKPLYVRVLSFTGSNSLFVYLLQIALIDAMGIMFPEYHCKSQYEVFYHSVFLFSVCYWINLLVHHIRKYTVADKLYKFLFN